MEKTKEEYIKIEKELDADVKTLHNAFNTFSHKYGDNIAGFTLSKIDDDNARGCWEISVLINGKLLR